MTAQEPREIELKFELDVEDVPRVRSLLEARLGEAGTARKLSSVYYDTADHDLAAAGVALRIRSGQGDSLVQTVKRSRGDQATLFQRDEWETPVETREPDIEAFARTPAGESLAARDLALAPCFETLIDRVTWDVTGKNRAIEVALDTGRVVTGRASDSFAEIELELKEGSPDQLFALLHDLEGIGSLRPGILTKSERGYRLLRNKPRKATKAEALHLTKHQTAAEAFQAIIHACLRHFGLNVPLVVAHRAPEALHQARVALRRLRSALSLFKDLASDADYPGLKADLQELSRALGEARNLDVYLTEHARPEAERDPGEPGLDAFLAEIECRRSAAYDGVVARLQSPEFRRLLLRLVEWVEAGPWLTDPDPLQETRRNQPVRRIAGQILEKRRRRVKRRGRHLAALDPEARHQVRIEAKKLRYAAEFFAGLALRPKRQERHQQFIAALETLQDVLGQLNDIATGHEIALSFARHQDQSTEEQTSEPSAALLPAAHVSGEQDAQTASLLEAAEAAHARLAEAKRFWSGWQD